VLPWALHRKKRRDIFLRLFIKLGIFVALHLQRLYLLLQVMKGRPPDEVDEDTDAQGARRCRVTDNRSPKTA
jgi:hypothetical protein